LTNAAFQYTAQIANLGFEKAMRQVPEFLSAVNTHEGEITYKAVQCPWVAI